MKHVTVMLCTALGALYLGSMQAQSKPSTPRRGVLGINFDSFKPDNKKLEKLINSFGPVCIAGLVVWSESAERILAEQWPALASLYLAYKASLLAEELLTKDVKQALAEAKKHVQSNALDMFIIKTLASWITMKGVRKVSQVNLSELMRSVKASVTT